MTDAPPEQAWFAKTDDDLEIACRALGPGRPLPATAYSHAPQCVAKHVKGFLVAHRVPFRLAHDLGYLSNLCTGLDPAFADLRPAARFLNAYIATAHYPSETAEEADTDAAREATHLAQQIDNVVRQT